MATNAPRSILGESTKSLILSFNIQQYDFVQKFNNIFALYSLSYHFLKNFLARCTRSIAMGKLLPACGRHYIVDMFQLCVVNETRDIDKNSKLAMTPDRRQGDALVCLARNVKTQVDRT